MIVISLLAFAAFCLRESVSFSWGTTRCSAPAHPGGRGLTSQGIKILKDDGELHISSMTPIRGFLVFGAGVQFQNPPDHSVITDVCGADVGAVMHSDSTPRDSVSLHFECDPGLESAKATIYVVFGYKLPYVVLNGRVQCPQLPSEPSTTTVSSGEFV